jgi:hypothetical protein
MEIENLQKIIDELNKKHTFRVRTEKKQKK